LIVWQAPFALWGLLAIPVILALHFMRQLRMKTLVSSNLLWEEILREDRRVLGLRSLLRQLSLILLLLTVLAFVLALARPTLTALASSQADFVLVIDRSASMQARMGRALTDGSRFDAALHQARLLIKGKSPDAAVQVIASDSGFELLSGFESRSDRLLARIDALQPTDVVGDPMPALDAAFGIVRNRDGAEVHFISDGAFAAVADGRRQSRANAAVWRDPRLRIHQVGTPGANVAIVAFSVRPMPNQPERLQSLIGIRNYTASSTSVPVSLSVDGHPLLEETATIDADSTAYLVHDLGVAPGGRAVAAIDLRDALDVDNRAFAVLPELRPIAVLLHTPGNFYLEAALSAIPGLSLTIRDSVEDDVFAATRSRYDLIVFDRIPPPDLSDGGYLLIDTVAPSLPVYPRGWTNEVVVRGTGESELVDGLDLSAIKIDRARRLWQREPFEMTQSGVPYEVEPLFWGESTDLGVSIVGADARLIVVGFDLLASNFPIEPAFPVFIRRSVEWLTRDPAFLEEASSEPVLVDDSSGVVISKKIGFQVHAESAGDRLIAVSLTDADESNINARFEMSGPSREATAPVPGQRPSGRSMTPWLLLIAIATLMLEWLTWSRPWEHRGRRSRKDADWQRRVMKRGSAGA
jgi:hypothetical protein